MHVRLMSVRLAHGEPTCGNGRPMYFELQVLEKSRIHINHTKGNPMKATIYFSLAASVVLAACGGGGSSTPAAPAAAATPPVSVAANFVTTVPASTYIGQNAAAFNLLNAERSKCGFGLLAQNAQLDAAATSHADYLIANNLLTHDEIAGKQGFSGANPSARAQAKGYSSPQVSEAAGGSAPGAVAMGETAVRRLMGMPYHLRGMVGGMRDVGIAARQPSDSGSTVNLAMTVFDFGYAVAAGPQLMATADVMTYPCQGSSGVARSVVGEIPNPVPEREYTNPVGTPILILVRPENTVSISSAAMIKVATSATVALRAPMTVANDPNKVIAKHEAFVMPDAALDANSQYQVTVVGTNNGTAFSRTFTFTTGSN